MNFQLKKKEDSNLPSDQIVVYEDEMFEEKKLGIRISFSGSNEPNYHFQLWTKKGGIDAAISKKMSKSNPNSAIFMTDSEEEIKKKFNKAYCHKDN
jgi:hypothetical protein